MKKYFEYYQNKKFGDNIRFFLFPCVQFTLRSIYVNKQFDIVQMNSIFYLSFQKRKWIFQGTRQIFSVDYWEPAVGLWSQVNTGHGRNLD